MTEQTTSDGRPVLKLVDPEHDAKPEVRFADALFAISRAHTVLAEANERAFVAYSDMIHGETEDE